MAAGRAHHDALAPHAFVAITLGASLVLQRFGIPAGGLLKVSVVAPIVLAAAGWCLFSGRLAIDRTRMAIFFGLLAAAAVSTVVRFAAPVSIAPRTSLSSLVHWLVLTSFAVLAFRAPMDERGFFRTVNLWLALVAAAGMAQFALQFVGFSVFGFTGLLAAPILVEEMWVTDQPIQWGSYIKRANGFFLVEPSVLSQFMAVGIMVEALYFRRPLWFAAFAGGMLASVSGTGFLVLAAFGAALAVASGPRGVLAGIGMAAGTGLALLVAAWLVPEVAEVLIGRTGEIADPNTSGYERFVTPFKMVRDVLDAAPWAAVIGIGPGTSEYLELPYKYWVNTPAKLLTEYGLVGFGLYLLLIVSAERTAGQRLLLVPMLVLLLFTGGYHQVAPLLFPTLLIITVARLQETKAAPSGAPSSKGRG